MKMNQIAVAVGAAMLAGSATAEFSANIGATSDYLWRGQTQSGHDAAISGGIDYAHDSGFYAGTWASSLGGGSAEVDLYAGFGGEMGSIGYDVGIIGYFYPSVSDADFVEVYGSLSYEWFTAGLAYTVDGQAADPSPFVDGDLYYYASVGFDIMPTWTLGGTIGYYDFDNDMAGNDLNYTHFQIDIGKSAGDFGDFTMTLSTVDGPSGSTDEDDIVVAVSWAKTFD
ncbi:MAG: TorF family putative porin [Gammaproteobacteria bacterium]|nr:TorF family putative porin [Gammaproteobacteria bacterium]